MQYSHYQVVLLSQIPTLKHMVVAILEKYPLSCGRGATVMLWHTPQQQTWQLVNKFKPNCVLSFDNVKIQKCLKINFI